MYVFEGGFMLDEIIIRSYEVERDRDKILQMLLEDKAVQDQFLAREKQGCDIVWVAYCNEKLVGMISHAGSYKRVKFLEYVAYEYRHHGIGMLLFKQADEYYVQNEWTERVQCSFQANDQCTANFLRKNGFYRYCSLYEMQYIGEFLPEGLAKIRSYMDEDFPAYKDISESAFWIMRNKVDMTPNCYESLGENERVYMSQHSNDYFVLLENDSIVAIGGIRENKLNLLAVRPDKQNQGYGRILASYIINELINRGNKEVALYCVVGNPAYFLYRSLGFQVVGTQHEYTKYYLPESRSTSHELFTTEEAIIQQFHKYGRL